MPALGIGLGAGAPAPQGGIDLPLLLLAALVVLALNAAWYIVRWPWLRTAQPDRLARKLGPKERAALHARRTHCRRGRRRYPGGNPATTDATPASTPAGSHTC